MRVRGFTLIELLVALGIAAMLMAGLAMTFSGAIGRKSVETVAEQFAAVLRSVQSQAISTKAPHVVYVTQNEYLVAKFVKSVEISGEFRAVPMLLSDVLLNRMNDVILPPGALVGPPPDPPLKWVIEKRPFKSAKVIRVVYDNGLEALEAGGGDSFLHPNYKVGQTNDSLQFFTVNAEGQFVGKGIPGSGNEWDVEGLETPSFVTFQSVKDKQRFMVVVISRGMVTVQPGQVPEPSLETPVILTMGERFPAPP